MKNVVKALLFIAVASFGGISSDGVALAEQGSKTARDAVAPNARSGLSDRYSDGLRKWTTADSISLKTYGLLTATPVENLKFPIVTPSPDGRYFYLVTTWGDVACECTRRRLQVFDSQQVIRALQAKSGKDAEPIAPLRSVEKSTQVAAAGTALGAQGWLTNNSLAFLGRDRDDVEQLYRLDVPSGKLSQLSHEPLLKELRVMGAPRGNTIVYRRSLPPPPTDIEGKLIMPVPRDGAGMVHFSDRVAIFDFAAAYKDEEPWTLPIDPTPWIGVSFSPPDAGRAILTLTSSSIDNLGAPKKFVLADFEHRRIRPLSAVGPNDKRGFYSGDSTAPRALWTEDASEVILTNTKVPGAAAKGADSESYIAAYEIASGRWRVLQALPPSNSGEKIRAIGWLKSGRELLVAREKGGRPVPGTAYVRSGDRWVGRTVPASLLPEKQSKMGELPDGLKVTLRQSANEPPVVMASVGSHSRPLSEPDPVLQGVWRAPVEPFEWRLPDGTVETGGLALPRSFKPGKRVPLVIQNGDYRSDVFMPDGHVTYGYARQALVAQGIAVLEFGGNFTSPLISTALEGPHMVTRIDAAVEALVRAGIADPDRVGLIGHSRWGFQTLYAVTHPGRTQLAAAEIMDSWTGTYPEYLKWGARPMISSTPFETINGGKFWQHKAEWLEQDALFNADRAEAATLFVDSGFSGQRTDEASIHSVMTMGAFQHARRPFDYMFFPKAGHVMPGARFNKAAMDLTVDWMNFWLQGREDPDPSKAEQYSRWSKIREQNEQRKAEMGSGSRGDIGSMARASTASLDQGASMIREAGVRHAADVERVRQEMKDHNVPDVGTDVNTLNSLGYKAMYEKNNPQLAVTYFKWNLVLFPGYKSQLEDGLAEGYLQAGDREKAIEHYMASLKLNPSLESRYTHILQKLKSGSEGLHELQQEARLAYEQNKSARRRKK